MEMVTLSLSAGPPCPAGLVVPHKYRLLSHLGRERERNRAGGEPYQVVQCEWSHDGRLAIGEPGILGWRIIQKSGCLGEEE